MRMVAVALVLVLALSACGKRGEIEPPEGQSRDDPRVYPPPR